MGKVRSFPFLHARQLALIQFQRGDLYREWMLAGRPASGLVPLVAHRKHEIASIASEVDSASEADSASDVDVDSDVDSEVDVASDVDVASEPNTTSEADNTSEADTTSEVDVASESDISEIAAEPVVQMILKKRKLQHQKSSKEEAARAGAMSKKRKRANTEELGPTLAEDLQAMKRHYIDRMVEKQQKVIFRTQTKFTRLKVSRKDAGRIAVLHKLAAIRDTTHDAQFALDAETLREYVNESSDKWGSDLYETGLELLDKIDEAKKALKAFEKMRAMVAESDN